MAELDVAKTTTPTEITDHKIASVTTDGINETGETFYDNENFSKWYGNYKSTTKVKSAIKDFVTWIVGLGLTVETKTPILENIRGSGKDTILSILWNMLIIKKVHGDSYAQIVRRTEDGTLINLKPLDPAKIRVVFNTEGVIVRYEQRSKIEGKKSQKFEPEEIFHLVNDRVADETHGDSIIESLEWNIEAQEEARRMYRKKVKNSGIIGIVKVATDNDGKLTAVKGPIKEGMEKGQFLIVPEDVLEVGEWAVKLNTAELIAWLNYLDDEFYQMIGLPKIIGGASGEIEGDSKVSYLAFEPKYKRAIEELKDNFWNQIGIKIDFNLPPSLKNELADNEAANTSQTGFQPNDTTAGVGA